MMQTDKVYSVTELTDVIRRALEDAVSEIWIRGEVSNLRRQSSGHVYFTLKDASSQISVVLFRADALRQELVVEEGMQLVAFGGISVYGPRGQYQLVARHLMRDGVGRLRQLYEELKAKLEAEGLFAPERKRPLPVLPRTVGIVTSPTGAALRDFISILRRREWTGHLVVLPARVQGQGAADEIAARIVQASRLPGMELLVIGRGGGSLEDLWPFNEEVVARAVVSCPLPVVSAVGHETDVALSDFVADKRAETPSAAAELISSAYVEYRERLVQAREDLSDALTLALERRSVRLEALRETLARLSPLARVEYYYLRLDELSGRLRGAQRERMYALRERLGEAAHGLALCEPQHRLQQAGERLAYLRSRLENASLQRTLQRGFAIARDEAGTVVRRKAALKEGQVLALDFADGEIRVRVDRIT